MAEMRKKGTGSYVNGRWRLKAYNGSPEVAASLKQLSELFKVTLTSKADSAPYWRKFLTAYRNYTAKKQGANSPLQERIRSLETLVTQFKEEKRPADVVAMLERELAEARAVPAHDIDHGDGPAIHPDMRPAAELIDAAGTLDDVTVRVLNSLAPKSIPKEQSLRQQIDAFVERDRLHCETMKAKGRSGKGWYSTRKYLTTFADFAGNIKLDAIDNELYQRYLQHLGTTVGNRTTRSNHQICLHTFLKEMEALDNKLNYGFVRVKKNQIGRPDGEKEVWTLEQVKTALRHATGDAKLMLMIGLNFGWYMSDYKLWQRLKNQIVDGHVTQARAKNDKEGYDFKGTYLVWEETKQVLADRPYTTLNEAFKKFREQYQLP